MDDYLSRRAVIEYIRKQAQELQEDFDEYGGESGIEAEALSSVADELEDFPAADVEPVRHGRDLWMQQDWHCEFKCSLCGADVQLVEGGSLDGGYFDYCPNCGARMDLEGEQ